MGESFVHPDKNAEDDVNETLQHEYPVHPRGDAMLRQKKH